jgi:hypothetical protein
MWCAVSRFFRRSGWALLALGLAACSTTTTPVRSATGKPAYSIECIELGECFAEARRACGGPYDTVSTRQNEIPESQLPGFNAVTDSHARARDGSHAAMPSTVPPGGPGIESDAPMPLSEVVVVCHGA